MATLLREQQSLEITLDYVDVEGSHSYDVIEAVRPQQGDSVRDLLSHSLPTAIIAKFLTLIPRVNSETKQAAFRRWNTYSLNRTIDSSDTYYVSDLIYTRTQLINIYTCTYANICTDVCAI